MVVELVNLLLVHLTLTNVRVCVGKVAIIAGVWCVKIAVFMNSAVLMICAVLMATFIGNAGLSYGNIHCNASYMAKMQFVQANTPVNVIALT